MKPNVYLKSNYLYFQDFFCRLIFKFVFRFIKLNTIFGSIKTLSVGKYGYSQRWRTSIKTILFVHIDKIYGIVNSIPSRVRQRSKNYTDNLFRNSDHPYRHACSAGWKQFGYAPSSVPSEVGRISPAKYGHSATSAQKYYLKCVLAGEKIVVTV